MKVNRVQVFPTDFHCLEEKKERYFSKYLISNFMEKTVGFVAFENQCDK